MPPSNAFTIRSRLPVVLAVVLIAFWLAVSFHRTGSMADGWRVLHEPALEMTFADTRTVTHSIDCIVAGKDPYTVRTFDPWHRLYNYPPIWLELRYLGVTSRVTNAIGTLLALLTTGAFLVLFDARNWTAGVVAFFGVTSPPVLFAIERGNNDLVVFTSIVFGFFLLARSARAMQLLGHAGLIVLLSVLKIYPVAAVAVFLRARRGYLKAATVAVVSLAATVLAAGPKLRIVLANTPQYPWKSFGAFTSALLWESYFRPANLENANALLEVHRVVTVTAVLLFAVSAAVGVRYKASMQRFVPILRTETAPGAVAVACLAIFSFVYASGSSFDYRLIFLLGVLGLLVRDISGTGTKRSLPMSLLIILYIWLTDLHWHADELFGLSLFLISGAWLGASLLTKSQVTSTSNAPKGFIDLGPPSQTHE